MCNYCLCVEVLVVRLLGVRRQDHEQLLEEQRQAIWFPVEELKSKDSGEGEGRKQKRGYVIETRLFKVRSHLLKSNTAVKRSDHTWLCFIVAYLMLL